MAAPLFLSSNLNTNNELALSDLVQIDTASAFSEGGAGASPKGKLKSGTNLCAVEIYDKLGGVVIASYDGVLSTCSGGDGIVNQSVRLTLALINL